MVKDCYYMYGMIFLPKFLMIKILEVKLKQYEIEAMFVEITIIKLSGLNKLFI